MEWVNNSTNRWINKRGRTLRWLSRRGGHGGGARSAGEPPMAEGRQLSVSEHAPSVQSWTLAPVQASAAGLPSASPPYTHKHLLPRTGRKKARDTQHLTGLRFAAQPGPRSPVLYTKTLMHPVKPLAGDTISSQAPIKPSVSTCDKDDHLFS